MKPDSRLRLMAWIFQSMPSSFFAWRAGFIGLGKLMLLVANQRLRLADSGLWRVWRLAWLGLLLPLASWYTSKEKIHFK